MITIVLLYCDFIALLPANTLLFIIILYSLVLGYLLTNKIINSTLIPTICKILKLTNSFSLSDLLTFLLIKAYMWARLSSLVFFSLILLWSYSPIGFGANLLQTFDSFFLSIYLNSHPILLEGDCSHIIEFPHCNIIHTNNPATSSPDSGELHHVKPNTSDN